MKRKSVLLIMVLIVLLLGTWIITNPVRDDLVSSSSETTMLPDSTHGSNIDDQENVQSDTITRLGDNTTPPSEFDSIIVDNDTPVYREVLSSLQDVQYAYFSELVSLSDLIALGFVLSAHEYDHASNTYLGSIDLDTIDFSDDRMCKPDHEIVYEIRIGGTFKGEEKATILLGRPEHDYNDALYFPRLELGSFVLLFASENLDRTSSFSEYWTFASSVVDINRKDIAVPRHPHLFSYGFGSESILDTSCVFDPSESEKNITRLEIPERQIAEETKANSNINLYHNQQTKLPHIDLDDIIIEINEMLDRTVDSVSESPFIISTNDTNTTISTSFPKARPTRIYLDNFPAPNKDNFGTYSPIEMTNIGIFELVDEADVIALGRVGTTLGYDYDRPQDTDNIDEPETTQHTFRPRGEYYMHPHLYHHIEVIDIWKGNPSSPFVIGRIDLENNWQATQITPLEEGQHVLLFAVNVGNPKFETEKFDSFYTIGGDNGLFVVDEFDRAFPKTPHYFLDPQNYTGFGFSNSSVPTEYTEALDLNTEEEDLEPFIQLSDLHTVVDRYLRIIDQDYLER